jgi:hypothetical protein
MAGNAVLGVHYTPDTSTVLSIIYRRRAPVDLSDPRSADWYSISIAILIAIKDNILS